MVGAGFSRNAFSSVPDTNIPPTLDNLEEALSKQLNPRQGHKDRGDVTSQLGKPNNFPMTAQEYEAEFGRGRLNQFLQDLIRDDQLKPTDMHKRLLRLPWRDVFTTNWDTLLERSLDFVPDQKYSILWNKDQIPLAAQPRIVKLHGSFPAHFPLICTQEDYRTYPRKFAPFVNTVRQAMMETVFLLIGFSGDDPNFNRWRGWIQDSLQESAPKIYLAGWLGMSSPRRKALERQNVFSIDLAHHPRADQWPEHRRHEYATKWILHALERGRPYIVAGWPLSGTKRFRPIPDILQPVVETNADEPKKEPWYSGESGSEKLLVRIDKIIQIWAHNRKLYPGWLAVPVSVRGDISSKTDDWEPIILETLSKFDPVRQLSIIYELIWRREILLDPLTNELESAAQDILRKINWRNHTIDGVPQTDIEWGDVRRDYRNVMLALLTTARLRFHRETFEKRLKALEGFRTDDPNVAHRIYQERCLSAIYSLDYESLLDMLTEWSLEDCDPVWMVRKASLLYEINRVREANELATQALNALQQLPRNGSNLARPSREGWSLKLSAVIKSTVGVIQASPGEAEYLSDFSYFYNKWRELAPLKCDAQSELHYYADALISTRDGGAVSPFDLGMKTIPGIQFSNAEQKRSRAAHRAIRLAEVAGLPTFSFDALKYAAEELSASEPEMAVRLILRTLRYDQDKSLGRILSRPRVAMMSVELARKLANICTSIIRYSLTRIGVIDAGGRGRFWTERMRVAMEVLSRLVVRLDSKDVEEVFDKSLAAYSNTDIIQELWLHQPLHNTLRRSWLSLPKQRQVARILDLLSAPILGVGNTARAHFPYPTPNELLHEQFRPPDRVSDNDNRWQQIISQLILGLNEGGEARKLSSRWVFHITLWKRLTKKEVDKVARALWNEKYAGRTALPRETDLFDWAFMVLPEPELGLAKQCFRNRYLPNRKSLEENDREIRVTIDQVGKAILGLRVYGKSLAFSEAEKRFLIDILLQWSGLPMPAPKAPSAFVSLHSVDQAIISEINGVSAILTEIQIPTELAESLYQKMKGLRDLGFPVFGFIPSLSVVLENRFDELTEIMRLGLVSQNEDLAKAALHALGRWSSLAIEPASHIHTPPNDLVREIGVTIANRRRETLGLALQGAKWIFDEGPDVQKQIIQNMTLDGLAHLLEELKYDSKNVGQNSGLPDLRNYSVQLALSMYEHGLRNNGTINRWLQIAKNDPLPELRYAMDPV